MVALEESRGEGERPFVLAMAAHALLALAMTVSFGHNDDLGDLLLLVAVPLVLASVWAARFGAPTAPLPVRPLTLTWCLSLASAALVVVVRPGLYVTPAAPRALFLALSLAALGLVASFGVDIHRGPMPALWRRMRTLLLLLLALGLGAWLLRASPAPEIDVWPVHQQGAAALLHGQQPYAPGAISTIDTHSHARAIEAYAYPPLNLLLTALGYAATGETRWSQLVAILVGAVLLRQVAVRLSARASPLPDLLMALLLFHPRGLFVLEEAWGEPLALPFLGGFALATLGHRPRLAAVLLGLLIALKQHLVLYLPALLLVPGIGLPGAALALGTAALTYLPFVLLEPTGVFRAVVMHHLENPFRVDSLSLTAKLLELGVAVPTWVGFVAAVASFGLLLRLPRTLGALLLASAVPFTLFYAFGRQAFCNYYYLLDATLLVAVAAMSPATERRAQEPRA